jgi:hypothetical protein
MERMSAQASAALCQTKTGGGGVTEAVSLGQARPGRSKPPAAPARPAKTLRRTPAPQSASRCGIAAATTASLATLRGEELLLLLAGLEVRAKRGWYRP